MTRDDDVRTLLSAAAEAVPVSPDLFERARDEAVQVRRRRWVRAGATGGTALATIGVLLVAGTQLPPGSRPVAGPASTTTAAGTAPATVPPPAVTTPVPGAGPVSPAPRSTGSAAPTRPTVPTGSRGPAGGPRFGPPVVADSFDGGLDRNRWSVYETGDNTGLSAWSAGETTVRGGALELSVHRPGGARPYTTGGVGGLPLAREYGRFSVRLRMTAGTGVIGQVALVPSGDGSPSYLLSTAGDRSSAGIVDRPAGREPVVRLPAPLTATRTLVIEWSPRLVRWTLDGVELMRSAGPTATGPHYLAVQTIAPGPDCGASPLPPACAAPLSLPQVLAIESITIQPYAGG